jgi:hypothetical protein
MASIANSHAERLQAMATTIATEARQLPVGDRLPYIQWTVHDLRDGLVAKYRKAPASLEKAFELTVKLEEQVLHACQALQASDR